MKYDFPTSKSTYIFRGITKACPRCGSRKTHTNYFKPRTNCPNCSLKFEREHGYWTGALVVNMIVTGGVVVSALIAGLILTVPNIPVLGLFLSILPIAIFLPIISFPFTHTLWMAIDYGFLEKLDI